MHSKQEANRHRLYTNSLISKPNRCDPSDHTMGADALKRYIGRSGMETYELQTKKFSGGQSELLSFAYKNSLPIRVIGAYREDLHYLLERKNAKLIGAQEVHSKTKRFNCLRQLMAKVDTRGNGNLKDQEIWVICFPSEEYVDQNAELIAAIISDFSSSSKNPKETDIVTVEHFKELESRIADWTLIEDFASLFVRHGDVVCIGNIDLFEEGILQYCFSSISDDFQYGGLGDMFGAKVLSNKHRSSRIVLIGFKESFWGNASAQLSKGLLNIGANHILYGSKAASMVAEKDVHKTYAPEDFILVASDGSTNKIKIDRGDIGAFVEKILINKTGISITVPTVMSETHKQHESLRLAGGTCMDCENGHIALALHNHNRDLCEAEDGLSSKEFKSHFLPLHFITDYIYSDTKIPINSKGDLGMHADESNDLTYARGESFTRIGNVFASYGLMFGVEDTRSYIRDVSTDRHASEETFGQVFSGIRPLLDAGLEKEALAQLAAGVSDSHSLVRAIVQIMICQKHGHITAAHDGLTKLYKNERWASIPEEAQIRLRTIALKLYSQIGSRERMLKEINFLFEETNLLHLNMIRQFGAAKRRQAVFFSLSSEMSSAKRCIEEANDVEYKNRNIRYTATNSLFLEITKLTIAGDRKLKEASESLAMIRAQYLNGKHNSEWWQTNFHKCATATLFLEASYYLCGRKYISNSLENGVKILTIAHLHNMRLRGNERSEVYAEIVRCTPDPKVRNIISLAMRDDYRAHEKYQNWLHSKFDTLSTQIDKYMEEINKEKLTDLEKTYWSPLLKENLR